MSNIMTASARRKRMASRRRKNLSRNRKREAENRYRVVLNFLDRVKSRHEVGCAVVVQAEDDVRAALRAALRPDVLTFSQKAPHTKCTCS